MNFPYKILVKGKGPETLQKHNYIAAGGEGTVCHIGGTAYKIYHDPGKMLPVAKIDELQHLSYLSNVLGPRDVILDGKTNKPVGFTMPYIHKTEFLCRLFNKNFKSDNNITPEMVVELVKTMQKTVAEIHKQNILLVDLNEMNFLTNEKYAQLFFIDVDSYQTPNFKATALMESVRDRQMKTNQFNEGTDWFSFAVVSFQLYMGYHPYRGGRHPKYKPSDWPQRMEDNVSVFNKDITLSPNWATWSLIPHPHLEWYKQVFDKKSRTIPPLPDGVSIIGAMGPTMIASTAKFDVTLLKDYTENIQGVYFYNGLPCVITKTGVYSGTELLIRFTKKMPRMSLANVIGGDPVLAIHEGEIVEFEDMQGNPLGSIAATAALQSNGNIYTIYDGEVIENMFTLFGKKIVHSTKCVCRVFEPATKVYPGAAVQDILGTCWLAIPYQPGLCTNLHIAELDKQRIVDAKYENGICIILSESKGKYDRWVLCFDSSMEKYTCRHQTDVPYSPVNFTTLANGVCVHIPEEDSVEVFRDNSKVNVVNDPPFDPSMKLVNDTSSVIFVNENRLQQVKLK